MSDLQERLQQAADEAARLGRIPGPDAVIRRGRQRRRRLIGGTASLVVLVLVAGALGTGRLANRQKAIPPGRPVTIAVPPGQEVTITVASGQSSVEIGRNLRDAGVVDSVNRFRDTAEERGLDSLLKPGTYRLVTGMSIDAVLDILARGPSTGVPLTIPEGWTVAQIAAKLAATEQFTRPRSTRPSRARTSSSPTGPRA
jgi:UPF0755 protein